MEKRAIIHEDWTPPEDNKSDKQKQASKKDLEASPEKRLADKVEASTKRTK